MTQLASRPRLPAWLFLALAAAWVLGACGGRRGPDPRPGATQRGTASWYGHKFHGRPTASGEIYDMHGLSAAHRTLPLGTRIEVTNLSNGRRLEVVVNDRGPFIRGRILDLSLGAARRLGFEQAGLTEVEIRVLEAVDVVQPRAVNPFKGPFALQVGAFRERTRAASLVTELRREGYRARVASSGQWHRVRIGPFERRSKAATLAKELEGRGYSVVLLSEAN